VCEVDSEDLSGGGDGNLQHLYVKINELISNLSENFISVSDVPEISLRVYGDVNGPTSITLPLSSRKLKHLPTTRHLTHRQHKHTIPISCYIHCLPPNLHPFQSLLIKHVILIVDNPCFFPDRYFFSTGIFCAPEAIVVFVDEVAAEGGFGGDDVEGGGGGGCDVEGGAGEEFLPLKLAL